MAVRPTKPFEAFVADLMGEAPGRPGERSSRLWWSCPAHPDPNPSFSVEPGDDHGHCFGCGFHPDAIDLVKHLNPSMTFAEAKAVVEGGAPAPAVRRPAPRPKPKAKALPVGWGAFAMGLVADAEQTLWSDRGAEDRSYLFGRKLTEATIRAARLGVFLEDRYVRGIFPDGSVWVPRGITIPWFEHGDLVMVNIRRPDDVVNVRRSDEKKESKYQALRGSTRGRPYPSRSLIVPGRPLAIVEGEFEALLLNQELAGLVPAVTFGSASERPKGRDLDALSAASPWLIATDADGAGDKSAAAWHESSERCRRVRPPGAFKDWTEAAQSGVDLRRWWRDRLAGVESPALFTWQELSRLRWGPSLGHDLPGLDVGRDRPLRQP